MGPEKAPIPCPLPIRRIGSPGPGGARRPLLGVGLTGGGKMALSRIDGDKSGR